MVMRQARITFGGCWWVNKHATAEKNNVERHENGTCPHEDKDDSKDQRLLALRSSHAKKTVQMRK